MRLLFLIACSVFFYSCHRSGVRANDLTPQNNLMADSVPDFPKDWLGYWEGDLDIYNYSGKTMTVPMALDNAVTSNDSVWTWAIIYGEDTIAGRRDYELNLVDAGKNHYRVDEKNGIFIDAYLLDNSLISTFSVAGNVILSNYELVGDEMLFSIQMFKEEPISLSGDTIFNGEKIPLVKSFQNGVLQKARLRRRK